MKTPLPQTTSELIAANSALWHDATHHRFLDEIQQGTLPHDAFSTWLVQDYHFVRKLLISQSLMLSSAPRSDQKILIDGLVALQREFTWFETNAAKFSLNLSHPLLPTCRAYVDFLLALSHQPYVVQMASLWAVERAYLDGWGTTLPCAPKYREFAERWTNPAFHEYVENIDAAANSALARASVDDQNEAHEYFRWVARYERDFWQMAFVEG